jgi:hypothetical protein
MRSNAPVRRRTLPQLLGALLLAAFAALVWYAWLGRDTEYQYDSAGQASGPYETWQVVGCVLSLIALLVVGLVAGVRPVIAAAAVTLAFTTAWTVQAAGTDDTGLFGVGATMLLFGMAGGSAAVAVVTTAVLRRLRPR